MMKELAIKFRRNCVNVGFYFCYLNHQLYIEFHQVVTILSSGSGHYAILSLRQDKRPGLGSNLKNKIAVRLKAIQGSEYFQC